MLLKEAGLCRYWLSFLLPQLSLIPDSMPILQTGGILLSAGVVDFLSAAIVLWIQNEKPGGCWVGGRFGRTRNSKFFTQIKFLPKLFPFLTQTAHKLSTL
jgi:hypothetical protein